MRAEYLCVSEGGDGSCDHGLARSFNVCAFRALYHVKDETFGAEIQGKNIQ